MTNLVDDKYYKLYKNVDIKQIRFQEGTDSYLTIYFRYASDEKSSFEIHIRGGVPKDKKVAFLIEVDNLLLSLNNSEYIVISEISESINNISL